MLTASELQCFPNRDEADEFARNNFSDLDCYRVIEVHTALDFLLKTCYRLEDHSQQIKSSDQSSELKTVMTDLLNEPTATQPTSRKELAHVNKKSTKALLPERKGKNRKRGKHLR